MTPAINLIKKKKIYYKLHEYQHDPSSQSYGLEAAEKLGVSEEKIFKTLVVSLDGNQLAVAVIPVSSKLNMKFMATFSGVKKVMMAEKLDVERSTGYILGGVSPLGQKKRLKTFIDVSAKNYSRIYISAGRRGLEIELSPNDLCQLASGIFAEISQ